MKCEMRSDGTIVITPETGVEEYALKMHLKNGGVFKYADGVGEKHTVVKVEI